ncbi:uncharacterized protein Z518_02326 [Rhinocladiella mackenziei CBS 650.93]|uniref:Uncharacterized protein n=1 Tax=Rhinocladiella mackenziei CBS 650.93 TaxID=1442369 RepID=A0A0D2FZF7_9EURO|nr:uncharacterized protein Z518_02326 [Rhinocladiella mackenziei CBS 650.93]KIX07672.1 hypothetical protein Z518_02326 [Rhinocladiella mackenziei CBS 650.93]
MASPRPATPISGSAEDPEAVALEEQWNEAIHECEKKLQDPELEVIRQFQGPQQIDEDLRKRLQDSAQGRLRGMLSQISPFFDILQKVLHLFTAALPARSIPLALVSGGAYLAVQYCAEFESAARRIIDILDKYKEQLELFQKYTEPLKQENYRQGLVQMFKAMIEFWVATVRFLSKKSRGMFFRYP